jgi:hypothetical protein
MSTTSNQEFLAQVDIEALFNWIEQQPELHYLRVKADSALCEIKPANASPEQRITLKFEQESGSRKLGLFQHLKEIVWVPGQSMRGMAFSTPELDSSLNSVAKLMCISTLWDFFTTIPLFQFSLSGPLGLAAGPMAIVLSFILLWASNAAGENSTDRRPGHSAKATWSLMAFVLLCTAKTLFSGVGVDLWIGSRGIASTFAAQLAADKLSQDKRQLKQIEGSGSDFQLASRTCRDLEQQMKELDRRSNEVQYISLFVRAYGQNVVTIADRGLTPKQLINRYGSAGAIPGICRQRDALQALNMEKGKPLAAAIETKSQAIAQKPALVYLQQQEPELFAEHFRMVNGKLEWVNGAEAVGQATNQFYSSLFAGNLGILGFPLFTLSVAVILTGAATILVYQISLNREVMASYSGVLLEFRDKKLDEYLSLVLASSHRPLSPYPDSMDQDLDAPTEVLQPIGESEAYDARSLGWLKLNARSSADKYYATKLYRSLMIDLWRKHIAETGQTYYPKLRNDLMDRYKLIDHSAG